MISYALQTFRTMIRTSFSDKRERLDYIQKRIVATADKYELAKDQDEKDECIGDIELLNDMFMEELLGLSYQVIGIRLTDDVRCPKNVVHRYFSQLCRKVYYEEKDPLEASKKMELPRYALNIVNILGAGA